MCSSPCFSFSLRTQNREEEDMVSRVFCVYPLLLPGQVWGRARPWARRRTHRPSACCSSRNTESSEMMYLCRHTMLGTQRGMMVFLFLLYSLLFLRPWQRTKRSVVPSAAFGACCALCLSTKLIYPSYSELQRSHSAAAPRLPVPGGAADGIWRASRERKMPQSCH